jgi:HD-like signal output (HDOD) protein
MFCIHDAQRGEVSILHGTDEVIVHDRQLVARILQAANSSATVAQKA